MKRSTRNVLVAMVLLTGLPSLSVAATEIQFWHAMTAMSGERVNDMATKFNASQSDYIVKAVHKGAYAETLNAAMAAYRAKQPPHIVHVFGRATQTMLSSGAVYPVYQLMKDNAVAIDWNDLIGPQKSYCSTGGNLYSIALNSATPILYYNKDHFRKAGLPDKAPATWDEVEAMAKKLQAAGVKCPFGSAWPSFVLVRTCTPITISPSPTRATGSTASRPRSRSTARSA
jgi:sn-glycerol 3-phosphate transport system substrate-binding protein